MVRTLFIQSHYTLLLQQRYEQQSVVNIARSIVCAQGANASHMDPYVTMKIHSS